MLLNFPRRTQSARGRSELVRILYRVSVIVILCLGAFTAARSISPTKETAPIHARIPTTLPKTVVKLMPTSRPTAEPTPLSTALTVLTYTAPATVIAALIGAYVLLLRGREDARNTFATAIFEFRLKQIEDFYAPALVSVEQSKLVYNKLTWMLAKTDFPLRDFRLLDWIFDFTHDEEYSEYRPLIEKILAIGSNLTNLIQQNAGLIEGGISSTFIEYKAHFDILDAASIQKPSELDREGSQEFGYYPRLLNRELREGYKLVLMHLENYVGTGDQIIARLFNKRALDKIRQLSEYRTHLLENLKYYERNALKYSQQFDAFDFSSIRNRFFARISTGRPFRILDAGAGSGRDMLAFVESGCSVVAVDASPAMIRECSRKLRGVLKAPPSGEVESAAKNSECFDMTFDEMTFKNEFDGVWAAASLLHVPPLQLNDVIRRLVDALKNGGALYLSLKFGHGEGDRAGRFFSYYTWDDIVGRLRNKNLANVEIWLSDKNGTRLTWSQQLYALFRADAGSYDRSIWLNVLANKTAG
jgi:SAM-dependent methyltransferase